MLESSATAVLKNYVAIAAVFASFAVAVVVAGALTRNQTIAYIAGVIVIGLAWVLSRVLKRDVTRGFLPYCFIFLLCTSTFPASDIMSFSFASEALYAGFGGMIILTVVLIWRAATYKQMIR